MTSTTVSQGERPSRQRLVAQLVMLLVALHLGATVVYLARPASLPAPVRAGIDRYMEPVFKQAWGVFAPDPVSYSTWLRVRAETAGGVTSWFDVSACDIHSAVLHHLVPDRRYLTTFQLVKHYRGTLGQLPSSARAIAADDADGTSWHGMQRHLVAAGASHTGAADFVESDRSMMGLVSQIAAGRWGDSRRVQIMIEDTHFVPYPARRSNQASERVNRWTSGWMPTQSFPHAGREVVGGVYGQSSGCTNESTGGPR
ncbi:DUF5819 family protein [Leekyejoonella antrihumi]|uniref:Uncharacterized protein n=1 Tax=Leekyejoonella antrihumi TaxID=1660198 RepID=A0A563E912_9MICO|nr:DUF5819 family protein [Leekyejoonella antrihumi]TWP39058.1 hypothetical protein FGL98_01340 [Leekyejoonella antrihumi]